MFQKQDIMRRVVYSLIPLYAYSVFLYGWRSLALGAVVALTGILAEFVFEKSRNKKVSEAVWVSILLYALSLPPATPFWVAIVGILFSVIIAKGVYGGFGRNVFNPAITGRMFVYISFPLLMQTTWMLPGAFGLNGLSDNFAKGGILNLGSSISDAIFSVAILIVVFLIIIRNVEKKKVVISTIVVATLVLIGGSIALSYSGLRISEVDVIASATPLEIMTGKTAAYPPGQEYLLKNDPLMLLLGMRVGSLGEGAIFLILAAAIYLLWTKTANWKTMIPTFLSALVLTSVLYFAGVLDDVKLKGMSPDGKDLASQINDILVFLMSGSLIFVAVFMVTDPVSGPNKPLAQVIYGIIIGSLIVLFRAYSAFPEGTSFAVLIGNTFANLLDEYAPAPKKKVTPKKEVQA